MGDQHRYDADDLAKDKARWRGAAMTAETLRQIEQHLATAVMETEAIRILQPSGEVHDLAQRAQRAVTKAHALLLAPSPGERSGGE